MQMSNHSLSVKHSPRVLAYLSKYFFQICFWYALMEEIFAIESFANFANLGQIYENKRCETLAALHSWKYIHKNFADHKKSQNNLIKSPLKR